MIPQQQRHSSKDGMGVAWKTHFEILNQVIHDPQAFRIVAVIDVY